MRRPIAAKAARTAMPRKPARSAHSAAPTRRHMAHARAVAVRAATACLLAGALAASPATGPARNAHATTNVTVTTLKLPWGSDYGGRGAAINDTGAIVGWSLQRLEYGTPIEIPNAESWGTDGTQINMNPPLALFSAANLLNSSGLVAGIGGNGGGEAYAWINRRPVRLAAYVCNGIPQCSTAAKAINDNGEIAVVRNTRTPTLDFDIEVALWKNGTRSPWVRVGIGQLNAMNSAGTMVGGRTVGSANTGWKREAFVVSGGALSVLPTPGWPEARAVAINDNGQILGEVADPGFYSGSEPKIHAVVWQNGQMTDLGTLGGRDTTVHGSHSLNNQGQVVGTSATADGGKHAFIWQNGQMTDLDADSFDPAKAADGSNAWAINDHGQVIGKADRGFFWQNGSVTWFPETVVAHAINNNGVMAGEVFNPVLNDDAGGTAPARIVVSS